MVIVLVKGVKAVKRRKYHHRASRGHSGGVTIILIGLAIILVIVLLDMRMRPVIESVAAYQAKVFASRTINDAMIDELEDSGVSYDELVKVTQSSDGVVTSIQTDMVGVNRLKSRMTKTIVQQLENREKQLVRVPLGTLIGNQITSGRGPAVEIEVIPTGYVVTEVYNQFTSAGINQTLHQIMLKTSVRMIAILPGYSVETETVSNFCVAETVIVGSIPEGFTQIDGDQSSTISKLNDYRAKADE